MNAIALRRWALLVWLSCSAAIAVAQTGTVPWTTGEYAYDGSGNITAVGGETYVYDELGRLRSRTENQLTQTYTYDAFGNILTITTPNEPQFAPCVDPATNRLDRTAGTTCNVLGEYTPDGNMRTYGQSTTFAYDALGQVTESVVNGNRRVHLYSATDERLASIAIVNNTRASSEWTIRDTGGRVLRRYSEAGGAWTWSEDYIYRDGQLLAAEVPGPERTLHFHTDHLGTPRLITGSGGAEISRHTYYPFGRELRAPDQDPERLKFTGHERDDINLDYMHARYYLPYAGRFLSVDPTWESADLGKPQTWNRYSYVLNDPVNMVDPDGKVGWDLLEAVFSGDTPLFEAKYDPSGGTLPKDPAERARYIEQNNKDPNRRSSTLSPGPHANESIPARDSQPKFTPEERAKMNEVGKKSGCHTCGSTDPKTKSGNFVPDHQPPSKINPPGQPQKLYPHCIECSRKQGGQVRKFLIELAEKARKLIPGI